MRTLLFAAALLAASPAWADYQWYIDDNLTTIDPTRWYAYSAQAGPTGLTGGTLISRETPGGSSDYEVRATITGAATLYVRSTADGSTAYQLACNWSCYVYKKLNGVFTTLGQYPALPPSATVRVVARQNRILIYLNSPFPLAFADGDIPSGLAGVTAATIISSGTVSNIRIGALDQTPPQLTSLRYSSFGDAVHLEWPAAQDDANGIGVSNYDVYRDSVLVASPREPRYIDETVDPGTHTYSVVARDEHDNYSAPVTQTFAATQAIEQRRTGVRSTGSYWGAAGEQIDLLSGNLNFSIPLFKALGRGGWGVTFALSYNSQNWRRDAAGNWHLGADLGFGYGWRLMAGSIAPVWSGGVIHHYVLTDASGAEYRLDQNTGGVWTSREGVYASFDAGTSRLYFTDGSFWTMTAQSSGLEADAGTLYPKIMQDTNGNQIMLWYGAGVNCPWEDSSARIAKISDSRAVYDSDYHIYGSFRMTYTSGLEKRLTGITGPTESYTFSYLHGQALSSPFDGAPYGTTSLLQSITMPIQGTTQTFQYAAGTGEMTQAVTPNGGELLWSYRTYAYPGGEGYREVQTRQMRSTAGGTLFTWNVTLDNASTSRHASATIAEPATQSSKQWWFRTDAAPYTGLASAYEERGAGSEALLRKEYGWTQNPASQNVYVNSVLTRLNPGQTYEAQSKTEQTLDAFGNTTQTRLYNYGNLTTAARTYDYAYLTGTNYAARYILNRLTSATLTPAGGSPITLVTNTYDVYTEMRNREGLSYHDTANYGTEFTYRGNVTSTAGLSGSKSMRYEISGIAYRVTDATGKTVEIAPSSTTGYSLPGTLTPNENSNLATSVSYTAQFAVTSVLGPNSATRSTTYDSAGRPATSTSVDGAVTTYTYTTNPPTQKATVGNRWKKTTLDGFGREVKSETGHGETTALVAETEYGPCACSPLGKVARMSQPHAPGATPLWTTTAYDGCGRTLTVTAPDGSATRYEYRGKETTVTDAAGKWKKYETDAFGNLAKVTEPRP